MATWDVEKQRWRVSESNPIRYCFVDKSEGSDHPFRSWTEEEKAAARHAINEWNEALKDMFRKPDHEPQDLILESGEGQECNVTLRWEDDRFFKDWTETDNSTNPPTNRGLDLGGTAGYSDRVGGGSLDRLPQNSQTPFTPNRDTTKFPQGEIYLNVTPTAASILNFEGWFVDTTPDNDDEFEIKLNDNGAEILKAKKDRPADNKIDFYTVIKHEFGHMMGLNHNGSFDDQNDRGELMRAGVGGQERRRDIPLLERMISERRHIAQKDIELLEKHYSDLFTKSKPSRRKIGIIIGFILLLIAIIFGLK